MRLYQRGADILCVRQAASVADKTYKHASVCDGVAQINMAREPSVCLFIIDGDMILRQKRAQRRGDSVQ